MRGAFVERILGLGFTSIGAGGGGAAASGDVDMCCAGIETGGEIGGAGDVVPAWPDIFAPRIRTVHGTRKDNRQTRKRDIGNQERWWWWYKRTPDDHVAYESHPPITFKLFCLQYIKHYPVSCT